MERAMSMTSLSIAAVRSSRLQRWSELWALIIEWRRRALSRYELMMLDDRELSDMGMTRLDACNERDKPFWQA
jgi:uncharacterized protein YjiS (DUF1127 family)